MANSWLIGPFRGAARARLATPIQGERLWKSLWKSNSVLGTLAAYHPREFASGFPGPHLTCSIEGTYGKPFPVKRASQYTP
jgi:hypothetical protein